MGTAIARLGDTSDHGGAIITAASHHTVEGKNVARVGDLLACPIHGANPIVTGSANYTAEGKRVARTGSVTACGAIIQSAAQHSVCA